jgi:hypothetical protein
MAIRLEQVSDPAAFAPEASSVLREAWATQTAIDYSPEYVAWQLSFPGSVAPVAFAAFDDTGPSGFAAATVRQLRLNSLEANAFVTSFWSMRPGRGGPATGIMLLETLLQKLRTFEIPVLTFGLHNGRGEQLFPRSYSRAGFTEAPLGRLLTYSFLVRAKTAASSWTVTEADPLAVFPNLISQCTQQDPTLLYLSASPAQLDHYAKDPRSRRFLMATDANTGARAAGWAVRTCLRTSGTVLHTPSLESVFVSRNRPDALPALLAGVSGLYGATELPMAVNAPNLGGFDPETLRSLGIRQTANGFHGHLYLPPPCAGWQAATATAGEII